jgi:hypothetical protein
MTNANPVSTPTILHKLSEDEVLLDSVQSKSFRTLASGLPWLARCTRPDIKFAVHQMTRRTHAPRVMDMRLGKRSLCYSVGTASMKLHNEAKRAPCFDAHHIY